MINTDILVHINGEPFVCSSSMKLIDLLSYLDFNMKLVAIEYNTQILSKPALSRIVLKHCDNIEVVTIVGGG